MSNDIVRQLLDGSRNIDRMRKEIDSVVNMLLGLLANYDITCWECSPRSQREEWGTETLRYSVFTSPDCEWKIQRRYEIDSGSRLVVSCTLISSVGSPGDCRTPTYDSDHRKGVSLYFRDVQSTHRALSVLVEGMLHAFPNLAKTWQPILDAATPVS